MKPVELIREVKRRSAGSWETLLPQCGATVPAKGHHGPCPACGGTDRFHFIDDHGGGEWHCRQCDAPNHGDALDLIARVNGQTVTAAAQLVAGVLGIDDRETVTTASQGKTSMAADHQQAQARDAQAEQERQEKAEKFTSGWRKDSERATERPSPYLTRKGFPGAVYPILPDGKTLVALVDESGVIVAGQTIPVHGKKYQLTGSAKRGAFHIVNTPEWVSAVILAEGLATAHSVTQMRPDALTVYAVDAGNLLPVAGVIRRKYPDAQLIIAADNDWHEPGELDDKGKLKTNTGRIAAEKAAIAVNGWIAVPPTDYKADWNDWHQQYGLESATAVFDDLMYQPEGKSVAVKLKAIDGGKNNKSTTSALNQMWPNQRGDVLAAHYDNDLAINGDSDTVHHYNGVIWKPVQDKELHRVMASIFIDAGNVYSLPSVKNAVDTMKLSLPQMETPERHLIGFRNGVFDTRAGEFRPHDKKDWLLIASDVDFSQAENGESLENCAPNFWHWLQHSTAKNNRKADCLLAALFMVLANRYDWQLFLEVTGPGGSGKSVMAEICTMLAGKGNTVSASMIALENPRERALVVGYSLIILPDMTRYAGDGAGIKAITGGDRVSIDPKHKAPYSIRIPAVVLAVNNNAMTFSDRSGGISRRRVIFNFSEVVSEEQRDPMLVEKIEAELPVIIRHLLSRFSRQDDARDLLAEQRKSEEALAIKREGDSMIDFCGYLMALMECEGMIVGNAEIVPFSPRRYLYHSYLAYMSAHGLGKPVSLTRFGTDMPGAMAEYGKEYKRKQCTRGADKGRTISNILLTEDSEGWLPAATGIDKQE